MNTFKKLLLFSFFLFMVSNISFGQNEGLDTNIQLKFDFGNGKVEKGYTQVTGNIIYSSDVGFGFISKETVVDVNRNGKNALTSDFCTSKNPFYFVIDLPEGMYEVKLYMGDVKGKTTTTVKAESRRLMLEKVQTNKGEIRCETISVNVRTPKINNEGSIKLKSRELNYVNWDNKLTIEFNNERPCINALEITEKKNLITVFLAGNSTVVDQEYEPWCSWGQMITSFFKPDVVFANYAESGEALLSFQAERRFEKIMSLLEPGDYLFIEFGHNDQKPQSSSYVEPFTGYKRELKKMIRETKAKGGIPVLVSSTQRRKFDELGNIENTHGDYPAAMKQTAEEENVAFIDLNAMSKVLFESLGIENSKKAFVHYPANTYPGQNKEFADNSHFSPYGAYQLAKCVVMGIKNNNLDLKEYITKSFHDYDPNTPDDFSKWMIPDSPMFELLKPDGY